MKNEHGRHRGATETKWADYHCLSANEVGAELAARARLKRPLHWLSVSRAALVRRILLGIMLLLVLVGAIEVVIAGFQGRLAASLQAALTLHGHAFVVFMRTNPLVYLVLAIWIDGFIATHFPKGTNRDLDPLNLEDKEFVLSQARQYPAVRARVAEWLRDGKVLRIRDRKAIEDYAAVLREEKYAAQDAARAAEPVSWQDRRQAEVERQFDEMARGSTAEQSSGKQRLDV